jgi:hypothetical protein
MGNMACIHMIPQLNPDGSIFFTKEEVVDGKKVISKISPEQCGYVKTTSLDIVVQKTISNPDSLSDEVVSFFMTLSFSMEPNAENRFRYFYKCRSGEIFIKDFEGLPYPCSKVSINDPAYVKRSRARKCPEDTLVKAGTPIFTLNKSNELERQVVARNPYSM